DGGVGMAQALGIRFLDKEGNQIGFGGGELYKITKIDTSWLDQRIKDTIITIASDVKNTLCGPNGASAVYGPQKGATPEMVEILDMNLKHFAFIIQKQLGKDILNIPGAGAAGGLGAALIAFFDAELNSGIELVMELVKLEEKIKDADVVITGEGSTDYQTLYGKVPLGLAKIAKKHNKPVVCISGALEKGYDKLYDEGINAFFSIVNRPMSLEEAINMSDELLERISKDIFNVYFLE
ncbi:MAG: glycerate kinase, partial [Thermoanaerobacteraceae bacterium]|nr:glycerate kinase [Thermoanaerobacteraceae bacterium]